GNQRRRPGSSGTAARSEPVGLPEPGRGGVVRLPTQQVAERAGPDTFGGEIPRFVANRCCGRLGEYRSAPPDRLLGLPCAPSQTVLPFVQGTGKEGCALPEGHQSHVSGRPAGYAVWLFLEKTPKASGKT